MRGLGAAAALAAMGMVAGMPMGLAGFVGGRPRERREKTAADEARIEAAKAKRARKGAKRLAELAKCGGAK